MSTSNSTPSQSPSTTSDPDDSPPTPALGSRENWWGDQNDTDPDRRTGYSECSGTDPKVVCEERAKRNRERSEQDESVE